MESRHDDTRSLDELSEEELDQMAVALENALFEAIGYMHAADDMETTDLQQVQTMMQLLQASIEALTDTLIDEDVIEERDFRHRRLMAVERRLQNAENMLSEHYGYEVQIQ